MSIASCRLVTNTNLQEAQEVRRKNQEGVLRVVALPLSQSRQELMKLRRAIDLVVPEEVQIDFQLLNLALIRLL